MENAKISGVTRCLSQGNNSAARGPLANTQKKNWEMIANPDVDGNTKTVNHRKALRKRQKILSGN